MDKSGVRVGFPSGEEVIVPTYVRTIHGESREPKICDLIEAIIFQSTSELQSSSRFSMEDCPWRPAVYSFHNVGMVSTVCMSTCGTVASLQLLPDLSQAKELVLPVQKFEAPRISPVGRVGASSFRLLLYPIRNQ
jgi:hypothetical protein